jgi:hypothetical protein
MFLIALYSMQHDDKYYLHTSRLIQQALTHFYFL